MHWYGKAEARPGRKMAHVTFCADTMKDLKDKVCMDGTTRQGNSRSSEAACNE